MVEKPVMITEACKSAFLEITKGNWQGVAGGFSSMVFWGPAFRDQSAEFLVRSIPVRLLQALDFLDLGSRREPSGK